METKPLDIMHMLAKQELALSALYRTYAELFPDRADFWQELVEDEKLHARWIEALFADVESGEIDFNQDRFNLEAIVKMIQYIDQQISRTKNEHINMINAVSITLDLEKSMIEDSFFEVYEGDHPSLRSTLNGLRKATQGHREYVEREWQKYNKYK